MADTVNGVALGAIAIGGIFAWSGLNNKKVTTTLQDLIKGQKPVPGPKTVYPYPGSSGANAYSGAPNIPGGGMAELAAIAESYQGQIPYCFGGALNAPSLGCPAGTLDCSSFANLCASQAGLDIPGYPAGTWNNNWHGPTTLIWLAWPGLFTVGHNGNVAQPGDLAIWQTHMGICTGANQMVSAQNPQDGIKASAINNFIPELLSIRRYKSAAVRIAPGPRPGPNPQGI